MAFSDFIVRLCRLLRDRRAATALIVALSSVPMIIAAGAAVDFSRIASARAQLQSAADAAALAGSGAFQTNEDGTIAYNVAQSAFNTAASSLSLYASVSSTVATKCNPGGAPNVTCGSVSPSNGVAAQCPSSTIYCVQVSARAVLKNSLLAFLIPTDVLNVTSAAQSTGTNSVGAGNFHHVGVGYGSDLSAIYAYAVPTDAAGNPEYNILPTPNSNCSNSRYGPIQYEATVPAANGVSTCNYVLIGENSGGSGTGSFSFTASDPISFTFVNFSGGTETSSSDNTGLDKIQFNSATGVASFGATTKYYNEIYVTTSSGTSYYPTGDTVSGTALYGYCPSHNLYGSINVYPNADPSDNIVPYQDSINTFSSAWEVMGYPPTHGTNHALLPFLGPANTQTINHTSYVVHAICPQWPVTGTEISATASFSPSALPSGYAPVTNMPGNFPTATNVQVYSTYYPDQVYTLGSNIYPPTIAGCAPASSSADNGVTPSSDDPWWGWSPPNAKAMDPGGAGENPGGSALTNCSWARLNSGGTAITVTEDAVQSAQYNNCAFLIQPLGTDVPATNGVPDLPDYYIYSVEADAFTSGATGNASNIVSSQAAPLYGMTPVYDGVGNSNAAGYVPTKVSITGSNPYFVTEPPAYGRDGYPPEDTSHQCYNPQENGLSSASLPGEDQTNNDTGAPIDPVENPEYGAVLCNSNPPPSYVLMWNDMGTWLGYYNDDLGYANALSEFTCPTPGNPGTSGPASLIY